MSRRFSHRHLRLGLASALLLAGAAVAAWHLLSSSPSSTQPNTEKAPVAKRVAGMPWFEDVTAASGIDFQHFDSTTPMHYMQETMGSGVAWIDYNNDGWPDLFCVQDGPVRPGAGPLPTSRLYRNNGDGTFTDVTRELGLERPGFGMGCAVGDFDNDGFDDLVVTYVGAIVLYHNEPDGKGGRRFVDITAKAGLHDSHWATSCAWGDIDGDGFLDLYVCNYVVPNLDHYPDCTDKQTGARGHCPPFLFANVAHQLYRNNGDGTFRDISVSSGVAAAPAAPGLGVLMVDLDGDGRLDIYVANDLKPQYLLHNQGGGRFAEKGLMSGCGLAGTGNFIAGMGVQAGDLDGSGWPSLITTNFQHNPTIFFRNRGNLQFQDRSFPSGIGGPSLDRLGFGAVLLDADLDGNLDIAVANGHVDSEAQKKFGFPMAQEAKFFKGDGKGYFQDISAQVGSYFTELRVGRGLAYADFDNDGRPDLVFSHNAGRMALLRNDTETNNAWLRLELQGDGKKSNRNAIGARVEIEAGGKRQVHFIIGGGSYLSASERRLLVGLGAADQAELVTVLWPSGRKQVFHNLAARRWWRLHEGQEQGETVVPQKPRG
ncbi:MAG TPA: CRTAC1 family protein [Gemmataceae bacterium]|nr:CRTAC1 family protein [Gemmataceae bacterium]